MARSQLTPKQYDARRAAFEWGIENRATWQEMADKVGVDDETMRRFCQKEWREEYLQRLKGKIARQRVCSPALTPEEVERRLAGYRRAVANRMTLTELSRELQLSNSGLGRWFAGQGLSLKWDALQELEWQPPKQMKQRRCLCCNAAFISEGFGNRLCASCRQSSVSPYHPGADGDGGRRVGRAR